MKRAAAIVLSLMMIWLQAVASAPTNFTKEGILGCCSCDKACCVSSSAPNSQPTPATPVSTSVLPEFCALIATGPSWTLPVLLPSSSFESASASTLAVPLFTRHCALLI